MDGREQAELYERAAKLFKSEDFAGARETFARAAAGPVVDVAHSAQMYVRMCERRMSAAAAPKSAEEQYSFAVKLMNQGRYPEAESHLRGAVSASPESGRFHYALALGHSGDLAAAADHLRRAIEIQPANSDAAKRDAGFMALAQQPYLRDLLQGERG